MARFISAFLIMTALSSPAELRFSPDGTFKIMQITDTHWSGTPATSNTVAMMRTVLDLEKPDLVVLTGDIVELDPAAAWPDISAPMIERNIPWAVVPGNHDDRDQMMALKLDQYPHCIMIPGPTNLGWGNMTTYIRSSTGSNIAGVLYFLDTNTHPAIPDTGGHGGFTFDQVKAFRDMARVVRDDTGNAPMPTLAFLHVPLREYLEVRHPGQFIGHQPGGFFGPALNSGMFSAMRETSRIQGTFVGHDHECDFAGPLAGICLTYGRVSGFDRPNAFKNGSRVIQIQEGREGFDSWIRCFDGTEEFRFNFPASFKP